MILPASIVPRETLLAKFPSEVTAIMEGNPSHTDDQKMICELYAHLCGAVAAHAKERSDYYAGMEFSADEPKDFMVVHIDPAVYLLARLYAVQLKNPCDDLPFVWGCVNAFPSKFPASSNAEKVIPLILEMEGWVNYMKAGLDPQKEAVSVPNENKWTDQKISDELVRKHHGERATGHLGRKLIITVSCGARGKASSVMFESEGTPPQGVALYSKGYSFVLNEKGEMQKLPYGSQPGSLSGEIKARALRAIAES